MDKGRPPSFEYCSDDANSPRVKFIGTFVNGESSRSKVQTRSAAGTTAAEQGRQMLVMLHARMHDVPIAYEGVDHVTGVRKYALQS